MRYPSLASGIAIDAGVLTSHTVMSQLAYICEFNRVSAVARA